MEKFKYPDGTEIPAPNFTLYLAGNNMVVHAVKKGDTIFLFTVPNLLNKEPSRFMIKNKKLIEIHGEDWKTTFTADRFRLEKWTRPTFNKE